MTTPRMPDGYEAFISYRRGDASGIARWIRNRLQRYALPAQVVAMLTPEKQELYRRKPRIYLDRAYEKSHSDFLQEKILPALDAAARLIVISTPSVFETIRDAEGEAPNWLVQEIEHFFADQPPDQPPRPIDVVIGPNGSTNRFPGRLAERERWDWIDLRAYNGWRALGFSEALDAGFTKLAAAIYDVPDAGLPLMRQEERRRRRRIITAISGVTVCILAALGFLGSSLWAETKARQAVDFERRVIVARGLLDTGDAPRAVQTLSGLAAEESPTYAAEARQALAAWSARLATASDRFQALADGQVFRWHGRNYLKAGGQLRPAFDGPPTLESAVTKDGQLLITFDADRRLRIRELTKPDTPLVETGELDATTGRISELFDGRMILFQAHSLILLSDEDMQDAQDLGGDEVVLLDPASRTYAVQSESAGEIRLEMTCGELRIVGTQIDLFQGDNKTSGNRLVVSAADSALHWDLSEADAPAAGAVGVAAAAVPGGCVPTVLADLPQRRHLPPVNRLQYPSTIPEAALWSATGTVPPSPEGLDLCPMEEAVADETPTDATPADTTSADTAAITDCSEAKGAVSVYPEAAETLDMILREHEVTPEVLDLGDAQRLAVEAVVGNQNYGLAYCAIGSDRSIGQCLATTPTARSGKRLRLQNQFLVLNGPEVHADMFQLIDLRSLHFMKVNPPLMEQLADVDFSADGTHMAALTARGEVWLYAVDRTQGSATALARYDFGGRAGAMETAIAEAVPAVAADAGGDAGSGDAVSGNADAVVPAAVQPNVFDTITYIGNGRLLMVGRRGGIVLADPNSGETLWARPTPRLLGQGPLEADVHVEANVIVLHDEQSAQLLTLQSGILLSDAVDVAALAKPKERPDGIYGFDRIGVQIDASGEVKLTYHDVIIEPLKPRPSSLPSPAEIVRRTGVDAAGRDVPLAELLAP